MKPVIRISLVSIIQSLYDKFHHQIRPANYPQQKAFSIAKHD